MNEVMEILLVDDDPNDVLLTIRELERDNSRSSIVVAQDGEEALDCLFCRGGYAGRSPERPPALVLLDLKLPKIDGLEVLRQVKSNERTRAIPVVILTSSGEDKDVIKSYELGVNSFVQKPVNFAQFQQFIKALRTYWLAVNQPLPAKFFDKRPS
jgi:two-component system response regulator